ncbi:cation:proton antiporter [Saccharopolyspora indica]|uniref:cation:proton antiporter domain-containing protein n=1 Tax=Saccharopolyspora indica TaxID=1229659 RepID=UPI0022EA9F39|nr:cation:proton antiporter [Saccharopolyspora indica]MDA3647005.1 cation:proton antiporter [Saccharopolyspora indica]
MSNHPAAKRRTGRGLQAWGVYVLLAVVPVSITVALVSRMDSSTGTTSAALGFPLAEFLLTTATVLAACKAAGWLTQRLGQPSVVGEIAAGVVLGPSVLGALSPTLAEFLLPASGLPALNLLAQLGIALFVFLAGLHLDTRLIRGRGRLALVISHVSIATPFLLGILLALVAHRTLAPAGVGQLPFAMFLGVSMSVTALPVLLRLLVELRMFGTETGVLAITCAVVDDVTAWTLLALTIALTTASSLSGVAVTIVATALFTGLLLLVVRPLLNRFVEGASEKRLRAAMPLALTGVLLCAMATEWIGVHAMFGAFLFGIVFPRDNALTDRVQETISGFTTTLLLPLFFAYSGLRTDLGQLFAEPTSWLWFLAVVLVAVVGKLASSAVAARALGEPWPRALQVGALLNCRGLTELVVLNIGLDLGVLSQQLFTILVLMALVSTVMTAPLVRLFRSWPAKGSSAPPARSAVAGLDDDAPLVRSQPSF